MKVGHRPFACAVVFFGKRDLKQSVNWMTAFWLSVAGMSSGPKHLFMYTWLGC